MCFGTGTFSEAHDSKMEVKDLSGIRKNKAKAMF